MYEMRYHDYIKSEAWQRKRRKFFSSKMWKTYPEGLKAGKFVCYCCGSDNRLDLHHRTYKRLGRERISVDLICVCRNCHNNIHKVNKSGKGLWGSAKIVRRKNV